MNDNFDAEAQDKYNNSLMNENEDQDIFELFMCGDRFYINAYDNDLNAVTWWSGLSAQTARIHMEKSGQKVSEMYRILQTVHEVRYRLDFFSKSRIEISLNLEERKKILTKYTNPSEHWRNTANYDDDIIEEYRTKVFENKLDDLIALIILTIKYKESKLISLLLTGLSNKGKTEVMKIMQMFMIKADRFESILNGTKIGEDEFNGIITAGMLVIDEVNRVKNMEKMKSLEQELKVSQNYKGGVTIPIAFYALTSASNPFDGADDEIANRIMHIALDGDFILTDSKAFMKDDKSYKENCTMYIKHKMLEVLNGDTSREQLKELQIKYRMATDEVDAIKDEVLEEIRNEIIFDAQKPQTDLGIISTANGLRIKSKGLIKARVRELLAEKAKGTSIQFDKTAHIIINDLICKERLGGKYYALNIYE